MNDDEPQQIQTSINEKKELRIMRIKKINLLKTESGMKLEEIARYQEKKNALNKEAEDRRARFKRLEEQSKELRERADHTTKRRTNAAQENVENMEEKEKLQEKFSSMLEGNLTSQISSFVKAYYSDAYAIEQNVEVQPEAEKVYARSAVVSTIAVCLEEEPATRREYEGPGEETPLLGDNKGLPTQYITTFRVSSTTRNYDLIKAACEFWGRKMDDYECTDERGEVFESKDPKEYLTPDKIPTLEKFWRQRRNENNQLLIIMRRKKKDDGGQDNEKDKAIDVADDDDDEGAAQNGTYQSYNTLLPKLKPYINISRAQVQEREKMYAKINNPKSFGENHFCVVFILAIILICMMLSIVLQKHMLVEFYTIGNLYKTADLDGISNVNSVDALLTEFLNNITLFFPNTTAGNPTFGSKNAVFRLYKPLMLRQYRVQKTDCQVNIPGVDCYYDFYSPETRDTANFTDNGETYKFTLYRGEVQMGTTINGVFGTYDRDAYITSYDPNTETCFSFAEKICKLFINTNGGFTTTMVAACNDYFAKAVEDGFMTQAEFDALAAEFGTISSNYISASTRALRISLYLFDISENNFISLEPIVEFTPIGTILTYLPRTTIFKPNLKENSEVPHNLLNIVIVVFATFLLLFVLYTLFTSGNGGINIGYFITLQGLLNTLVIILCYIAHNMIDRLNGFKISQETLLLDSSITSLTSVNELSDLYETIFIIKSLVVGFLLMRLALVLKLNTRIEIIVTALQNSIPHILMMTICFGPIALSLAFLCTFMLGPDNTKFDSFGKSFAAILVLLTGNEGDILVSYQPVECILIIIGFFFLYFLILSVFPAIHVENYRQTLLDFGEDYHKKYTWKRQDYTAWLFSWVPNRIKDCQKKLDAELNAKLKIDKLANLDPSKVTGLLKKAGDILPVKKKEKEKEKKSKKKKQKQSENDNQA